MKGKGQKKETKKPKKIKVPKNPKKGQVYPQQA